MNLRNTLAILFLGSCFALHADAQELVAVDSGRNLYTIDKSTGARSQYAQFPTLTSTAAGLAHDIGSGRAFLTSTGNDSLYSADLVTGNATLIGAYGPTNFVMHGLEFDVSTGTLYGLSSNDNGLYTIDQTTGAATLVGTTGLTSFSNLCYDVVNNTMYLTNSGADSFYSIDRATGAVTLIGPLNGPTNPNAMAFELATDTIYMTDNSTDTLYTIDRATGAATAIGSTGSGNILGLVSFDLPGSITRIAHACGTTTIAATGMPTPGQTLTFAVGNAPATFVGFGFNLTPTPFCVCTVGHDWGVALFANSASIAIPNDPSLIGVILGVQGAGLGGTGGCTAPRLTFTDTLVVTVG